MLNLIPNMDLHKAASPRGAYPTTTRPISLTPFVGRPGLLFTHGMPEDSCRPCRILLHRQMGPFDRYHTATCYLPASEDSAVAVKLISILRGVVLLPDPALSQPTARAATSIGTASCLRDLIFDHLRFGLAPEAALDGPLAPERARINMAGSQRGLDLELLVLPSIFDNATNSFGGVVTAVELLDQRWLSEAAKKQALQGGATVSVGK